MAKRSLKGEQSPAYTQEAVSQLLGLYYSMHRIQIQEFQYVILVVIPGAMSRFVSKSKFR